MFKLTCKDVYLNRMSHESADSLGELSVRRSVESVEAFLQQLDKLRPEGEQLHERGDGEGGRIVDIRVISFLYLEKVSTESFENIRVTTCRFLTCI